MAPIRAGGAPRGFLGGMALLALGGIAAAGATALMASSLILGLIAGILAFLVIGVGVGASGTNLLALLAAQTPPARKAAAAAIVWIMMIFGFVLTAALAGQALDPFSMLRMVMVTTVVCTLAFVVCTLAILGLEKRKAPPKAIATPETKAATQAGFIATLKEIWQEDQARRFTGFIFVSMLAYSAQDLILEPFAGLIYGFTPGESTKLAGTQHGGVLLGMIATAILATTIGKSRAGFMRMWTMAGCLASAAALLALAYGATVGAGWPLKANVFALGLSNGAFAVAAIGSMMTLASAGRKPREGTRMGLWGASQAIAFGVGGFLGAVAIDLSRLVINDLGVAFASVFALEGLAFVVAAWLALRVGRTDADTMTLPAMPSLDAVPAE